jgi:hypothetical protein
VVIDGPGVVVASGTGDITVGNLQVVGTGATLGLLALEGVTLSAQTLTNGVGLTHGFAGLGGFGTVNGSVDNEGVIIAASNVSGTPATLDVTGNVSGIGAMLIEPAAELVLGGTVGAGQLIAFFPGARPAAARWRRCRPSRWPARSGTSAAPTRSTCRTCRSTAPPWRRRTTATAH